MKIKSKIVKTINIIYLFILVCELNCYLKLNGLCDLLRHLNVILIDDKIPHIPRRRINSSYKRGLLWHNKDLPSKLTMLTNQQLRNWHLMNKWLMVSLEIPQKTQRSIIITTKWAMWSGVLTLSLFGKKYMKLCLGTDNLFERYMENY